MTSIKELPTKVIGMSNQAYRMETEFDSRSFLHTVAKFGGEVQKWIDDGKVYWAGSTSTSKGSEFDELVTGVLGGKQFDDMLVVPPDEVLGANGSRSTKAYKEWAAQQTAVCVTADVRWQYQQMLNSMRANEACSLLMEQTVKTTSNTWDRMYRSVIDYGYAEQEWLYVESAKAIGLPHFRMPFVFVQTMPPFACRVFHLPIEIVEAAGRRLLNVMEEVRLRRSTGMYMPADANEITDLAVPAWAKKEEEYVQV